MTAEEEKIETCRTAMKAALEAIEDYCGVEPPEDAITEPPRMIRIDEEEIPIKVSEVLRNIVRDDDLSELEKFDAILKHPDTRKMAEALCDEKYSGTDVDRMTNIITAKILA